MTRVSTAVFNPISVRFRQGEPVSVVNKEHHTRLQTDDCPISAVGLKLNSRAEIHDKKLSKRNCRNILCADEASADIIIDSVNNGHRTRYSGINTDSLAYKYIQKHIEQATSSDSRTTEVPNVQNTTHQEDVRGFNERCSYDYAVEEIEIPHSYNHASPESFSDSEGSMSSDNGSKNVSRYFVNDNVIPQHKPSNHTAKSKQSYIHTNMNDQMSSVPCDGHHCSLLNQTFISDDQSLSHDEIKHEVNVEDEYQGVRKHRGRKNKTKSKSRSRKGKKKEPEHSKSNKYRASSETETSTRRSKNCKVRCLSGNGRQQLPVSLTKLGAEMLCTGVKLTRVPPLNCCSATFHSQNPINQFRDEIDTNQQLLNRHGYSKSAEQYMYKFAKHQQYFNDKSHWRLKPKDDTLFTTDTIQNMKLEPLSNVYENLARLNISSVHNPHCDGLSDSAENEQRISKLKRAITEMQISEPCSNVPISHSLPGSPGQMPLTYYNIRTKSGTLNLPRQTKVYLSEKQSGSIQECGGKFPCAPPATPTTFQLERYQYIPSMNDIKAQRSVRMRLEVLEMAAQRHKEKQKKQQALQEKQRARVKLREQKNQQRREIYALNKLMTELENGRFEAFCVENGIDPT